MQRIEERLQRTDPTINQNNGLHRKLQYSPLPERSLSLSLFRRTQCSTPTTTTPTTVQKEKKQSKAKKAHIERRMEEEEAVKKDKIF